MRQTQAETDPRPQRPNAWWLKYSDSGLEVELVVIRTSHKACFYNFLDHHCLLSGLRHSLSATVRQYFPYSKTSPILLIQRGCLCLIFYSCQTLKTKNNHQKKNQKFTNLAHPMCVSLSCFLFLPNAKDKE